MSNPVLETLFYPLHAGFVETSARRTVFWHARYHRCMDGMDIDCQSYWKQDADDLARHGFSSVPDIDAKAFYDIALVAMPKNVIEARSVLGRAVLSVKPDGYVIAAAGNKEGGTRLAKIFELFGLQDVHIHSRNKCRVAVARVANVDLTAIKVALEDGDVRPVLSGDYLSQPGVFGWDKIDVGSALLAKYFPEKFIGRGADFGCGYGYLSRLIVERLDGELCAIDADVRSVCLCSENVPSVEGLWLDIVSGEGLPTGLDFIVMNPPFHEGKRTDSDIGAAFIEQAARCLKKGGVLWMVANTHLPYELFLERGFSSFEKIVQANGFKVFKAIL
jgi:16S rRNA (guanine1207-N2)-methyltransferase